MDATGEAGRDRQRILVVEDEAEFGELVALWLTSHGWDACLERDGEQALRRFRAEEPALVLLDVGLPGLDGWELLARIREESRVPVLLVTARGAEADKLRGLGAGADDYITKPFSFPELMARVQAALRRARPPDLLGGDGAIRRGPLVVDPARHRVQVAGREVHLTPTEFRLLEHLASRPDRVVAHRELLEAVWGPAYVDDAHLLRVTMRNLRAKLGSATPRTLISTVYGAGYRFTGG
ncbi:MAG TPA: response regulator transcription factor [Candidatus Limnocylindrales bacterium]